MFGLLGTTSEDKQNHSSLPLKMSKTMLTKIAALFLFGIENK